MIALVVGSAARQAERERAETYSALREVVGIKSMEVSTWVRDRRADARVLLDDAAMVRNVRLWFRDGLRGEFFRDSRPYLEAVLDNYAYEAVAVLDESGEPRYTVADRPIAAPERLSALLLRGWFLRGVVSGGPYLDEDGRAHIDWLVPLIEGAKRTLVGGILLRVDPSQYLYPLVAAWPGGGRSAETYLVRQDDRRSAFITPSLSDETTGQGGQRPRDDPLTTAAIGKNEGVVQGPDYGGVEVLGAYRRVPATDWTIVAKVDEQEVVSPARREAVLLGLLTAAIAVSGGLALWVVWRRREVQVARAETNAALERVAVAQHYEVLSKHANDTMLLLDDGLGVVEANDAAVRAYGYERARLRTLHLADLRALDAPLSLPATLDLIAAGGGAAIYESRHRRADGSVFPTEVSVRTMDVDGQPF